MAKKKKAEKNFDSLLILFRFFLNEIGVNDIHSLGLQLNNSDYEGVDSNGDSYFYGYIKSLPHNHIDAHILHQYDENILRHLTHIGERRGGLKLKYFQYLSLLFTEIFLDRYFSDKDGFVKELNYWLQYKKEKSGDVIEFSPYTPEQLNKLAFMCATGSGKTLTMHINVLQYLHYYEKARTLNSSLSINRIILVTPNEGMSKQHLYEFQQSNIDAEIFSKDGLFTSWGGRNKVLIIDINKFSDTMGDKTIAVDSFESNNLVLVDEAHRGLTSGDTWVKYRKRISEKGFSFEYSATFKQSLNANARNADDKAALEEYCKAIIMDYSYKYFYNDGYGKDYRIFNLESKYENNSRQTYLVGCLLAFYQQMKFYQLHKAEMNFYNIEKPLLVFVGNKVLASTSKSELSDVQEILVFIDSFVRNKRTSSALIEDVLHARTGIVNESGEDIFAQGLRPLLEDIFAHQIPNGIDVYNDILRLIFNTTTTADEPRLHVENLRQVPGEIALRIGDCDDYFGVINIGDAPALIKVCEAKGITAHSNEFTTDSLFSGINTKASSVNILIGSRKFTEGWNSWRVSTMGLINFAKSEGSQAIQLFGRGVRLKGIDGNLKRSSVVEGNHLKNINCLETLWIFGVKAQYMEVFRKIMAEEGISPVEIEYRMPVLSRFDETKKYKLRVIRVKPGINFKKQAERLCLTTPDNENFLNYLRRNVTRIDCMSKAQSIISDEIALEAYNVTPKLHTIPDKYLPFLDYYRIFEELRLHKDAKGYYNVTIIKDNLQDILAFEGWYELIIPGSKLDLKDFSGINQLTDFAILALKSYLDKYFKFCKEKWEAPYLELAELESHDVNFVDEYIIRYSPNTPIDTTGESLADFISHASNLLAYHGELTRAEEWSADYSLCIFDFRNHLYAPLISLTSNRYKLQISPVTLNDGEREFVMKLKKFTLNNAEMFESKSLFLLRNKSKGGIGFFEADNFYPDFILWIDTPDTQYISFIDPKGLLNVPVNSPKIQLFSKIKELQNRLQPSSNGKKIILNSFIMSVTSKIKLESVWHISQSEWQAMNVYTLDYENCIHDMINKILSE